MSPPRTQVEARLAREAEIEDEVVMCLFVTPMPTGIECAAGLYLPVVPRNSSIPTRRSVFVQWNEDLAGFLPAAPGDAATATTGPSETRTLRIFLGGRAMAQDNLPAGQIELHVGTAPIQVVMDYNANEVLTVNGEQMNNAAFPTLAMIQANLAETDAHAEGDRAQRREILEGLQLHEDTFLSAALYQTGDAIVMDVASLP